VATRDPFHHKAGGQFTKVSWRSGRELPGRTAFNRADEMKDYRQIPWKKGIESPWGATAKKTT